MVGRPDENLKSRPTDVMFERDGARGGGLKQLLQAAMEWSQSGDYFECKRLTRFQFRAEAGKRRRA